MCTKWGVAGKRSGGTTQGDEIMLKRGDDNVVNEHQCRRVEEQCDVMQDGVKLSSS